MVSNQKPLKTLGKNPTIDITTDNKKDLEKRINTVLNVCQDIINSNNNYLNKQNVVSKKKATELKPTESKPTESKPREPKPTEPANTVKKNASEVTLEKVTQDMTNILKDLKDHLPTFKSKNDSFSDVVPKLEESFLKSNQNTGNKTRFFNNCKAKPAGKPQTYAKNAIPKSEKKKNNQGKSNPVSQTNNIRPSNACSNDKTVTISTNYSKNKLTSNMKKFSTSSAIPPRIEYNPLGVLKAEVQKAMKEKKTFTIKGTFPAVRRALLNRGWVEKLYVSYSDRINEEVKKFHTYSIPQLVELLRNRDTCEVARRLIKSKLLADNQVDLYWSYSYDAFKECPDKIKLTKINRFRKDSISYASKLGLCNANKRAIWFKIPGVSNLNHPRTYSLIKNGDTPEFIKDFNRTAAMSLLKWVVKNNITGEYKVLSPSGKIPIEVFDFAINECYKFIKKAQHEDIDNEIIEAFDYEWNEFLEYFYKAVHIGNHFKKTNTVAEIDMVRKANFILSKLEKLWPYLEMDGMMNIWILKPTNGSQGIGIHICRTLQYILKTIKANPNRRYIIQKYIERPLLIHNTKFDIRQWFLISSSVPLMIWMYKLCYLRFSSQTYNLRKLHESIHLTNNSVQSRYRQTNRDIVLPSYDMWDLGQFKNYLSDKGYPNAFDTIIYPGMKECVIAAVIMYQDKLERRKNCFELYGADFMITENFKPWLIEINSSPALHASTPVTAKMCPLVLEDVIKVVIDYEANKFASTGHFELVYQTDLPKNTKVTDLQVQGTPVTADYFYTPPINDVKPFEVEKTSTKSHFNMQGSDALDYVKHIGTGMRKTLEDLLEILKKEKQKRHERKNKSIITILSNIITETKESQTEYDDRSGISENLIKSQILEVEELQSTENEKHAHPAPSITTSTSGTKQKGDSKQNNIKSEMKENINKKETISKPKIDVDQLESRQETKTTVQCETDIKENPQEIKTKFNKGSKSHVTENSLKHGKERVTIIQKSDTRRSSPGKEAKVDVKSESHANEINQDNKTTVQFNVINEQFGKNEKQRKSILQCRSYTYGKSQDEIEPKIIFRCRSDIKKFQENGKELVIQSKSEMNEKLVNLKQTRTIIHSKSNINEPSQDENQTKMINASASRSKQIKNEQKNISVVETSDHNVCPEPLDINTLDNTLSDSPSNDETSEKTQNNPVPDETLEQVKETNKKNNVRKSGATKELNEVTMRSLLNFFRKAKKNATNKQ